MKILSTMISLSRSQVIDAIQKKLEDNDQTLVEAIADRNLYLRISLVGACNLSCAFCHNEGAPKKGRQDLDLTLSVLKIAYGTGFRRIQFTGGEPLLHPQVSDYVRMAKTIYDDVGITTNGVFLPEKIDELIDAGISRIHVSLQLETLEESGTIYAWGVPNWLTPILSYSKKGYFRLQLNLPIPYGKDTQAKKFLVRLSEYNCDLKVFSILPQPNGGDLNYSINKLEQIVCKENRRREEQNIKGEVILRGYRSPNGIRCGVCPSFNSCKEQSHSLRLGADGILRPCLATREWDLKIESNDLEKQFFESTLLSLDYLW